jgi:transposase
MADDPAGSAALGSDCGDGGYANRIDKLPAGTGGCQAAASSRDRQKRSNDVKGFQVLPRRWVVERRFGWLVGNRRLARDHERLTTNSETMIKPR